MKQKYINFIKTLISIFAIITLMLIFDLEQIYSTFKSLDNLYFLSFIILPFLVLLYLYMRKIILIYDFFNLKHLINSNQLLKIQSKINIYAEISSVFMVATRFLYNQENNISYKKSIKIILIDKMHSFIARCILVMPSFYFFISLFEINFISINYFYTIVFLVLIIAFFIFKNTKFKYLINFKSFQIFSYSLLIQIILLMNILLIFILLNPDKSFIGFMLLIPLIITIQEIPISITSFGYRELTFIYILQFINIDQNISFLISLLYGLLRFLSVIIFYYLLKLKIIRF